MRTQLLELGLDAVCKNVVHGAARHSGRCEELADEPGGAVATDASINDDPVAAAPSSMLNLHTTEISASEKVLLRLKQCICESNCMLCVG
jgi:hypothetical protein